MNLLKETIINPVEEKSLLNRSSGISPTDKIKDSLGRAYRMGKEAIKRFISSRLVSLEKSIYNPIKRLKLGTFSNMTKRVTIKLRGRVRVSAE